MPLGITQFVATEITTGATSIRPTITGLAVTVAVSAVPAQDKVNALLGWGLTIGSGSMIVPKPSGGREHWVLPISDTEHWTFDGQPILAKR